MDSIVRVAFGVQLNSLEEPNNPIIEKAKKMFSTDMPLTTLMSLTIAMLWPQLGELFGVRFCKESIDFFYEMSLDIVKQKRKEFKLKCSNEEVTKASNFIELLIEAEQEVQMTDILEDKTTKSSKCKFLN